MTKKKDIHILVKRIHNKNRYYPYIISPAHGVLWVTVEKVFSPVEEHRAYTSTYERLEQIIEMIESGEIR